MHLLFPPQHSQGQDLTYPGFADLMSGQCKIGGIDAPCGMRQRLMEAGAAVNETLIQNGGRSDHIKDPIKHHGVGVFTTYLHYLNEYGEPNSQRFLFHAVHKQKSYKLTPEEVSTIKELIAKMLSKTNCRDLIKKLTDKSPEDILAAIDEVQSGKGGGFFYEKLEGISGKVRGSIGHQKYPAQVISEFPMLASPRAMNEVAHISLHEMLHAMGFGDIANAVKLGYTAPPPKPGGYSADEVKKELAAASTYWDPFLRRACEPTEADKKR